MTQWWADRREAARLPRLRTPTLLLSGAEDVVLVPANNIALDNAIPQARWEPYADAGHAMMYQYPQALAASVERFLRAR